MQNRETLLHSIFQLSPKNEIWRTPIPGLTIYAADRSSVTKGYIQDPSLCVVMLGERQICTNGQCQVFGHNEMMFCPVNLPVTTLNINVPENSDYLSLSLRIDFDLVARTMAQLPDVKISGVSVNQTKWQLIEEIDDCLLRLLNLLYFPKRIDFIAPLILQELYFYLLQSPQGNALRSLVVQEGKIHKIAKAAQYLEQHYLENVNMGELAKEVGMSVAGFYAHFKNITSMTPLQYQKSLRLNMAREKLQAGVKVSEVAYESGYESPSQFSREYKRQFGSSPKGK